MSRLDLRCPVDLRDQLDLAGRLLLWHLRFLPDRWHRLDLRYPAALSDRLGLVVRLLLLRLWLLPYRQDLLRLLFLLNL